MTDFDWDDWRKRLNEAQDDIVKLSIAMEIIDSTPLTAHDIRWANRAFYEHMRTQTGTGA